MRGDYDNVQKTYWENGVTKDIKYQTNYQQPEFKHLVLPIWINSYTF
ncbi:hypothetical protein AB6831_04565 [Carnobacterium divergens]|nr:hypothetical protein [Carnobacterium divergens]MCO6017240.1 hypothetical protein [Carnobacterium divergens]SPC40977.1 hypothetical protein CDIMF43_220206 [Carnobacterium divergens]